MILPFHKYQGCGNDFILLDGRAMALGDWTEEWISLLCHRRFGIGADGLMVLEEAAGFDFHMRYWNANGKAGSMCGNGARCMVNYAHALGIGSDHVTFLAPDGPHEAIRESNATVRLHMGDVDHIEALGKDFILHTGSPHYVRFVSNLRELDVYTEGHSIRHSKRFAEEGINVNFVERIAHGQIFVRTFERGVEAETMSCGTGVTASALIAWGDGGGRGECHVLTPGGPLRVAFQQKTSGRFEDIWLIGPGVFVFAGEVDTIRFGLH